MNPAASVSAAILWLLVLVGYLLGSIPFGYLLVRLHSGRDVRFMGSGNIGATNVARTAGWLPGIATLTLDAGKGFLAVWLMAHFSGGSIRFMTFAGLAALVGHVFPIWLRFSGGKGVATAAGAFLGISWPAVLAAIAVFVIVAVFWRYVSLASISAAAALPLMVYILYAPGHAPPGVVSATTLTAAVLVIMKHQSNLKRLMAGKEPRIEFRRKKE